jgi:hypothetical protein
VSAAILFAGIAIIAACAYALDALVNLIWEN